MSSFRKYQRQYKFNDKTAHRHKHSYVVDAIAELHRERGFTSYHQIKKCDKCNSFYCVSNEGGMSGLVHEFNTELPIVRVKSNHKWCGEFKDLELV